MSLELCVLTLNIWGIPFVSSDREERIKAICLELNSGKYDIVSLQEVWSQSDFQKIRETTEDVLPYAHYFFSGVFGSGLLVLSKYPIIATLFHCWSVNGYFHRVQHADWFGGKGVGLTKILVNGKIIHLYNAHLHAEYDNENDEYKTHRVIQAFDTAQFIEETRGESVLQILAGDLNTQPQDISYKVLLYSSKMQDSCSSDVTTHECLRNSYTSKNSLTKNPSGIRIDHIFLRSSDLHNFIVKEFTLPFPERVPGQKFSFSDHEAVLVKLQLTSKIKDTVETSCNDSNDVTNKSFYRVAEIDDQNQCDMLERTKETAILNRISVLHESIDLCDSSLQKLRIDRILYFSVAVCVTFLLLALVDYTVPVGFKTLYLLLKFFLFGIILFCVFMGSIWNYMEHNGILSGKMSMEIKLRSIEKFELCLN